ncbi:nuclear transport factor 2 family protein [Nocardia sp. NPDC050710]|uniref:nuclear transport factor 2 family protein n=1 Tax=Nocardia sp. NPDC050710 TaxID=3157220 RepID=UPI0033D538C7
MTETELLDELLTVERRGWDALCTSTGAEFYGSLMSDDALMILADGAVLDRAAVVASLKDALPWRAFDIEDPRVVVAGRDAAVLVYIAVAYLDSREPAFRGAMSSTYIRTPDCWRLACYQQTRFPD